MMYALNNTTANILYEDGVGKAILHFFDVQQTEPYGNKAYQRTPVGGQ